jgi:hypothetical protein
MAAASLPLHVSFEVPAAKYITGTASSFDSTRHELEASASKQRLAWGDRAPRRRRALTGATHDGALFPQSLIKEKDSDQTSMLWSIPSRCTDHDGTSFTQMISDVMRRALRDRWMFL